MLPPSIDQRQLADLVEEMKKMTPYYTPEWRFSPEQPDAAAALFFIFADLYLENIKRLNKAPMKHYMAFLNLLDLEQLPAQSSKSRVIFELSEGMNESVHIPKGTQVSAKSAAGHDIYYETNHAYMVTPANLQEIMYVSKTKDLIVSQSDVLTNPSTFQLFSTQGNNLQEHAFFLHHERMFHFKHGVAIEVFISNSLEKFNDTKLIDYLINPQKITWYYFSRDAWIPFDQVTKQHDRSLVLYKHAIQENEVTSVNEQECVWIKCKLNHYDPNDVMLTKLKADRIECKTNYFEKVPSRGIEPDLMFSNDMEVANTGHFPFGEEFTMYSCYYISSAEVFCKSGAIVELTFDLKWEELQIRPPYEPTIEWKMVMKKSTFEKTPPLLTSIAQVAWEYWDGKTWAKLTNETAFEEVLHYRDHLEMNPTVSFECPNDFEISNVNGHDNYWIRMKVVKIDQLYSTDFVYMSPWISNVGMKYHFLEYREPAQLLLTYNNLEHLDQTSSIQMPGKPFRFFYNVELDQPAMYFGFNLEISPGVHHLYFSIQSQIIDGFSQQTPQMEWEFARASNGQLIWEPLKVLDETMSFTVSGFVKLLISKMIPCVNFMNQNLCWIRAINRDKQYEHPQSAWKLPTVKNLYLNGVEVIQQETIRDEYVEQVLNDDDDLQFKLLHTPFHDEEIWVDETGMISDEHILWLEQNHAKDISVLRDSESLILLVWVKWQSVRSLTTSHAEDRHYVLNRTSGVLQFGDGQRGMAIPDVGSNRVKAHYKKIIGAGGNVAMREIISLQNALAYVEKVYNPEPAIGGCQPETIEHAIARGPKLLQHRNRCVTAKDFEAITLESNLNIAKVKCLSRAECPELVQSGTITLVVQPSETLSAASYFPEMKRKIEQHLLSRASQLVAFPELIRIIEPVYLEISVFTLVTVQNTDEMYETEQLIIQKTSDFLHPNTGNFNGTGWAIGETIHISMLYGVLKSIPEISFVKQLTMDVYRIEHGERIEIDPQTIKNIKHGVIINGTHRAIVDLK